MKTVYLDNNATTPIDPFVKRVFIDSLELYGNPSSMHQLGREAREEIEKARAETAKLMNAQSNEIFFTAGGSESNNMVLQLVLNPLFKREQEKLDKKQKKIITTLIEHPAVLETCQALEEYGIPVSYLPVDSLGKIDLNQLDDLVDEETALVSIMTGNNEIGTLQDIQSVAEIAHKAGALVHTDAVQALGKIPVDVKEWDVDYLSFSGHKLYAPKGIGGIYIRNDKQKKAPMFPFVHGGHQENGFRAGTYNTSGIIAMGAAAKIAGEELHSEYHKLWELSQLLKTGIRSIIPDVVINGHEEDILPGTLNVSFPGAEGESILLYLDLEGIEVSTGSACATGSLEPSHVLLALGLDPGMAHGSIRFSIGKFNSREDIEYVLDKLPPIITKLRNMSTVSAGGKK